MATATRSLLGAKAKLALLATSFGGGVAAATIATSDNPSTTFKVFTTVPVRLLRDSLTAANIVFDYEYSLWGLPEGSVEKARVKHEVHERCAHRLQELCFRNGGIYIKLGQHISQLEYLVPEEYVRTMRASMLNKCPVSSYDQVCEVFKKELGGVPDQIFKEFNPVPLASASLAQVHVARTHDGKNVAVKVQHTHMTDTAAADYATVEFLVNTLHWLFPSFDYRWLVVEMRESLPKELNFLLEAENSKKCLDNFRRLSPHLSDYVYAPRVYWNLTTSKLLTMEFMDGAQINDVKEIQRLGIQPSEVAKLVSQAFAEMMFKHGFVHCDPHAANLLVRPLPSSKTSILGKRKPQLILLDHGLYKDLDVSTRTNYAALWKALVFADAKAIKENSAKLGAGEDLYALFAGILTMRPWSKVIDPAADHLVVQGNDTDRSELQMYASQYFPQISELLGRLPRVILLMLKTNDCLRAINNSLIAGGNGPTCLKKSLHKHILLFLLSKEQYSCAQFGDVLHELWIVNRSGNPLFADFMWTHYGAHERPQGSSLQTFLIIGRVSSEAVLETKMMQRKSLLSGLCIWLEEILLEARLFTMQIAVWLLQLRKALSG